VRRAPRPAQFRTVGFYDDIRRLFAATPDAVARGYTAARFSFNVKGGRCEECAGEGVTTTSLQFMPDVETPCLSCDGARYNDETLEVRYGGLDEPTTGLHMADIRRLVESLVDLGQM